MFRTSIIQKHKIPSHLVNQEPGVGLNLPLILILNQSYSSPLNPLCVEALKDTVRDLKRLHICNILYELEFITYKTFFAGCYISYEMEDVSTDLFLSKLLA